MKHKVSHPRFTHNFALSMHVYLFAKKQTAGVICMFILTQVISSAAGYTVPYEPVHNVVR